MPLTSTKSWIRETLGGDFMPDAIVVIARYLFCHRRIPNIFRPRRFTEKMLCRILFDRRPQLSLMADKYRVRDYVRERLGESALPVLFHATTDPRTIPFDTLPDRFVVKPTHGSQWVRVITDKSTLDREDLIRACDSWLADDYYKRTREWGYKQVTPRIIVEELIEDGNPITPHDYKLFVYDGRTRFIHVVMSRFVEKAHIVMTPDWKSVDVHWPTCGERIEVPPPPHLQQMMAAAEQLAAGFDFLRVDFYDTGKRLVFGELTGTAGGCTEHFKPDSFDFTLGEPWKIDRKPLALPWIAEAEESLGLAGAPGS